MNLKNGNGKCPDFNFCAKAEETKKCLNFLTNGSKKCFPAMNGKPESKLYMFVLELLFEEGGFKNDDKRVKRAVLNFLKMSEGECETADRIIDEAVSSFLIRNRT